MCTEGLFSCVTITSLSVGTSTSHDFIFVLSHQYLLSPHFTDREINNNALTTLQIKELNAMGLNGQSVRNVNGSVFYRSHKL